LLATSSDTEIFSTVKKKKTTDVEEKLWLRIIGINLHCQKYVEYIE
jgi:hypothetical protein